MVRNVRSGKDARATADLERLQEALWLQKAVLNGTGLALIFASRDCVIKVFNEAAERLLGYAAYEVIGARQDTLFFAPEDLKRCLGGDPKAPADSWRELLQQQKESWEFDCPMIHENGSRFMAAVKLRRSADGARPEGFVITATQRSTGVPAEHTLGALAGGSREAVFALDPELCVTAWNPGCERITGIPRAEALGQRILALFPELKETDEPARLASELAGETVTPGSGAFAIKNRLDEKVRFFSASYTPVTDESGGVTGLAAIWHDVTNLKTTEDRLLIENEFSEALIRSSNDGIFAVDRHYCITEWNPAVEAMSGVKKVDALGRIALDLHPVLHHNGEADRLSEALEGGQTIGADQRYRLPGKGTRYYSTRYSALRNQSANIVGALGVVRDITDSKTAESELRRSKEAAETADRAKTRFLANMSHEIRTPMNAIIGLSTILLDTELTFDQRKYIETVRLAAQSLLAIINQILDFSKLSSSHFEFENLPLSLRSCVDGAVDLIWTAAAAKSLQVTCDVDPEAPETIMGDATRLRQILLNLLGNAVKFTERGVVHVAVKARPKEGNLWEIHFAVRDSGIGIPADKLSILFKPFHQADSSTTRKYGGTGLGLAISKQLAEQMGGKIWVETEIGRGSTFQFTILAEAQGGPATENNDAAESRLTGLRALIIDGGKPDLAALREQLPLWLMDVPTICESISGVRECSTKGFFDVVIVDRDLPDVSLQTINELLPKKVPFVLVHSAAVPGTLAPEEVAALEDQAVSFLAKPLRPSEVRDTLYALFANEPAKPLLCKVGEAPNAEFASRRPLRLLVAEDHPVNQMLTLLLLSRLGYKAQMANNGIEVLSAMEKDKFDVIFMDMQMPEMDGVETTQRIHQLLPKEERPWIIALTANAMNSDRDICVGAGMQDFVTKPVELGDIRRALERVPGEHVREPAGPVAEFCPTGQAWQRPESLVEVFNEEPELGRQLVEMFLEDAKSRLATLQSIQTNQKATVILHGLQGSFRQIGAGTAGALAMKLETAARASAPDLPFLDFKDLAGLCEQVFDEINEFLAGLPAPADAGVM